MTSEAPKEALDRLFPKLQHARLVLCVPFSDADGAQLEGDDWEILHRLLTRPLVDGKSPADVSRKLRLIADFAQLASMWCEENGR